MNGARNVCIVFLTVILVLASTGASVAQGTWTEKALLPTPRDLLAATSAVFAPDLDGAGIGLLMPPDPESRVAVPHGRGNRIGGGTLEYRVGPESVARIGELTIELEPGQARTVVLRWPDPLDGPQENFVHLHCPADGEQHVPGLTVTGG